MKKLSFIDKILYIINSLLAAILLFSYTSYYISPNTVPLLSVISLTIPILIILNAVFVVYWLIKFKRAFLISTIVLLIGFQYVLSFYRFSEKKVILSKDVKLMTYNVRGFNMYNWIDIDNIDKKITDFVKSKNPDILCLQEYHKLDKGLITFPYKYINTRQAIYSKYRIVNSGSLNFSNTGNNAIFVDILKDKDTIRIYNVHLQSLHITPEKEELTTENSEKLRIRLETGFKIQANQAALVLSHQKKTTHKSIICGDFNNTAFSWVYKHLKEDKNDAFEIAGEGFGATYDLKFPLRIDFILTDEKITVNNFKTYDIKLSDHSPIMARLNF